MLDILVVGDQHITPDGPTEHFEWLAALIRDRRPDVVVNLGDVIDSLSMSVHSGPAEKAIVVYTEELQAAVDVWAPAVEAAKAVGARLVYAAGNHDDARLARFLKQAPWLRGALPSLTPLMEAAGWECYPYLTPAIVGGIAFAHSFVSGVMGRPIGGVNVARSMATKLFGSALAGHSHIYQVITTTTPLGERMITGQVGCFIHPLSQVSDWAGPQVIPMYDRGVVYIHDTIGGFGDVEWISLDRLQRNYALD